MVLNSIDVKTCLIVPHLFEVLFAGIFLLFELHLEVFFEQLEQGLLILLRLLDLKLDCLKLLFLFLFLQP